MNDFFLAKNGRIILPLNEVEYAVGQVCMRDFDQWLYSAEPIKKWIDGRDLTDELANDLTTEYFNECILLCEMVVDGFVIEPACLAFISKFIAVIVTVNQAYFSEKKDEVKTKPKRKPEKKDKTTWFDSFQILVSHGHSHESIMNMTYGAFTEYLKAIKRHDQDRMIQQVNLMRIAHHADEAGFSKFTHEMQCG